MFRTSVFAAVAVAGLLTNSVATGKSLVRSEPKNIPSAIDDPFALGKRIRNPQTPGYRTRASLIRKTMPNIWHSTYVKYAGNFAAYWRVHGRQRAGFGFEAVAAHTGNRSLIRRGQPWHWLVTGVEGSPHNSADLALEDNFGYIRHRRQLKLRIRSLAQARKFLLDPRYKGNVVQTSAESIAYLEGQLKRSVAKAARRGLPLSGDTQIVQEALQKGRLTASINGQKISEKHAIAAAKRQIYRQWKEVGRSIPARMVGQAGKRQWLSGVLHLAGRSGGKVLVVADIAAIGSGVYSDIKRFHHGQILTGRLATQGGMRTVQVILLVYATTSPEGVTKTLTGVAILVIWASEALFDHIAEAERSALTRVLESIDRNERFFATYRYLVVEFSRMSIET